MQRKIEYFHAFGAPGGHGEQVDDPFSPSFVPMELRGEQDKTRWWAAHFDRKRKADRVQHAEFTPGANDMVEREPKR